MRGGSRLSFREAAVRKGLIPYVISGASWVRIPPGRGRRNGWEAFEWQPGVCITLTNYKGAMRTSDPRGALFGEGARASF